MTTISIITVCFNNLQEMVATCRSVDMQQKKPFEHIIIDGSVTPGIKDHLEQNAQPAYRKWICEPDKGIADAFNKGLHLAQGNVVVMLNSGDTLFDEWTIATVSKTFEADPSLQWLHGKQQLTRGNQKVVIGKPFEPSKLYRGMRNICHQAMYFKKTLHDTYGMYDENEKIGMDYDFLCRIAGEPFTFINAPLVIFAPAGASSVQYLQALDDARRIYEKHFGKSLKQQLWQVRLKFLYFLLQSPVGNLLYKLKTRLKLENM